MLYKLSPKCIIFTHFCNWEQTTVRLRIIFHCFTLFYVNLNAIAHNYVVVDMFFLFFHIWYTIPYTFAKHGFPGKIASKKNNSRRGISNLGEENQNLVEENQNLVEDNQNLVEENQISSRKSNLVEEYQIAWLHIKIIKKVLKQNSVKN